MSCKTDRDRLIELLEDTLQEWECDVQSETLSQIAEHLIENGVIVPPCKVGDTVYDICTIFDESTLKSKTIIKPRIIDFVSKVGFIIESKGLVIGEKDFGKTVFLTKDEADKKLEERNGK